MVHDHALLVLLLVVGLAAVAGVHAVRTLGIDTSTDDMLDEDLPFRREQARFLEAFPHFRDLLVIVVDAPIPETARAVARGLAERLEADEARFAEVWVPRADPWLERHGLYHLDEAALDDLADRLASIQPFLGRLTRDPSVRGLFGMLEAAYEARLDDGPRFDMERLLRRLVATIETARQGPAPPLSWQAIMDAEDEEAVEDGGGARQIVLARAIKEPGRLHPAGASIAAVRRHADALPSAAGPGVSVRITGGLAMEHDELATVQRGFGWIALVTLLLVFLVLYVGLRSSILVLASVLAIGCGLLVTAAFAAVAVGHLNLISIAFGVLFVGLGADYVIHLGLRYRTARAAGEDNVDALRQAGGDVGGSLLLCSVTTAIGFYAFVPTDYAGVSELGLISGTGMFVSLVVALTVMPAVLALRPLDAGTARRRLGEGRLVRRLAELPRRRARPVLAAGLVLGLAALALVPRVRFDLNPINLRDPASPAVATFRDLLDTSETPPWSITILAGDDAEAERLADRLRSLDAVDGVVRLASFVPDDQEAKALVLADLDLALGAGLDPFETEPPPDAAARIAAVRSLRETLARWLATEEGQDDEAARALARALDGLLERARAGGAAADGLFDRLEAALLGTLPASVERLREGLRSQPFEAADLPDRIRSRWVDATGEHRLEVFPAEDLDDVGALRRFADAVRAIAPEATGAPVMIVASGRAIIRAFRQALGAAVVASLLVLALLLRSLKDAALVLAPLLLAGALTAGATVVLDLPLNFANVIALPLLLGIGVDSSIHVVHRSRGRLPARAAGNPLLTSTGRGVVFSALTTLCSFGNLAFSPHPGTASMGLLLAVGILAMLLATLVFLPALLVVTGRARAA